MFIVTILKENLIYIRQLGTCSLVGKQLNPKKTLFSLAALIPCTIVIV